MTAEERVAALRLRVAALREKRERRKTAALGAGCAVLAAGLALMVFSPSGGGPPEGAAGAYTGAALLYEHAGGYVLTAVAAFMAGVTVTALCARYRRKRVEGRAGEGKERDSQ